MPLMKRGKEQVTVAAPKMDPGQATALIERYLDCGDAEQAVDEVIDPVDALSAREVDRILAQALAQSGLSLDTLLDAEGLSDAVAVRELRSILTGAGVAPKDKLAALKQLHTLRDPSRLAATGVGAADTIDAMRRFMESWTAKRDERRETVIVTVPES